MAKAKRATKKKAHKKPAKSKMKKWGTGGSCGRC